MKWVIPVRPVFNLATYRKPGKRETSAQVG